MVSLTLVAVFLPFVTFPIVAMFRRAGPKLGWVTFPIAAACFGIILYVTLQHSSGDRLFISIPWVESIGVNLTFLVDGLSLLFGLIVSGMGSLIFFYAATYLDSHYKYHNRFYAYLLLFMGSMLGTVFSSNLIVMFVFWELTGISSFLLIGFLHDEEASQRGARMALLTTIATGLLLFAGILLAGIQVGSFEFKDWLEFDFGSLDATIATITLLLFALGAFGKSAQVPFHFWLPNAMAAPTPVSAYLHSATMVKLGVFLVARIFVLFRDVALWEPIFVGIGFTTLLVGSIFAFFAHKLKEILAYTTVAMLGLFIGVYGLSEHLGARFDFLHILNHVAYKGGLFMVAGIIDHATHVKDLRRLGGLFGRMPLLTFTSIVLAASMAGFPLTFGFISKEYLLAELFRYSNTGGFLGWWPLLAGVVGFAFMGAVAIRILWHGFFRRETEAVTKRFHFPGTLMHLPPVILAVIIIGVGVAPQYFTIVLQALHTTGLQAPLEPNYHLGIWHGFTPEFLTSVGILCGSALIFLGGQALRWRWEGIPRCLRVDELFDFATDRFPVAAGKFSALLRSESPLDYLPIVAGMVTALVGGYLWVNIDAIHLDLAWALFLGTFHKMHLLVAFLIVVAAAGLVFSKRWTTQIIFLSTIGFLTTVLFVLYRAPDLALTQILVEAATLVLVLLLLARFPKSIRRGERTLHMGWTRRTVNLLLSIGLGAMVFLMTYGALTRQRADSIGQFYLDNTVDGAMGANAVNTILVDFRGFDTLLEITVLVISVLGCLGMLMRYRRTADELAEGPHGIGGFGINKGKSKRNS